jgi:transposase
VGVLGRVDRQGVGHLPHRHRVTPGTFYERLATHGHELVADEDFAHCYAPGRGRPSIPPSVMVRALLLATHDKTSDVESARRSRVDLDWRAALGVGDEVAGIGATTFSSFRARLVLHDADRQMFARTVERAVELGALKGEVTAIIDSSPVIGAGAVADTYTLVRQFTHQLAAVLAAQRPKAQALAARIPAAKPRIDWHDAAARRAHLAELVAVARALLAQAVGVDDPAVVEAAGRLGKVLDDDVEPDPDDGAPRIRQGVAPDRMVSASDPEQRHGRKSGSRRFDGHKAHVVGDEASELVLAVGIGAGNGADATPAAGLVRQTRWHGVRIGELLADMAYSDGDTRVAVEAAGAVLVAKVPPVSNGGRLAKTDFVIDLDAARVTCPAGQTTCDARPTTDAKGRATSRFHFPTAVCAACPLREQCVKGTRGRTIEISVHERRMAAARAAERDPEVADKLRRRAKVERKIDHLQDVGMAKARYRGRRKTLLQLRLAAVVVNLDRLVALDAFTATSRALAA